MAGGRRVNRILCAADPRGDGGAVDGLLDAARQSDAHMIALVGDLGGGAGGHAAVRSIFHSLGRAELPSFWVPGPADAPIGEYLREAYNSEVVYPALHGVHGTAAFASGQVLVAGFGGEVMDDLDAARDEVERLRYPRWEAEYRLKLLRELKDYELVLLFATPPSHKAHGTPGSEVVAELVGTYRPRVVVCAGERRSEMLGRSLIVAPGSLSEGRYALVDLQAREAELLELPAARADAAR
jgi:Icc-related predicted phosphoesterase